VAEQVMKALSLDNREQWISQSECLRLLGLTDWNRYDALNTILDRIQRPPFTNQANHTQQLELVQEQLAHYRLATKPAQVKRELQQVSQMVARYPQDVDLRWNLATLMEAVAEMDTAREQWRTLLRLQPQSAWPRFNLARSHEGNGEQAEAISLYEEGLQINPEYYPAQFALGSLYLRTDRLPEATRHLNRALQLRPRSIEARLALGQVLARAHKSADAEKQFQQVLQLDPNNEVAHAELQSLQKLNP
jgi:tetratricopeptide (TPR) repeat protein